jgi:hypothetical protein
MADDLDEARRELDKEFADVRKDLRRIHDAVNDVEAAGPEDDVSELLERLEDVVKEVRTGGLLGGGAKGHKAAREAYLDRKRG